jgi:ABC-type Fe3+/spermidine/putrescine transport system ATPase subunit
VLLLDEPLAALDRKLRVEMRLELKRLQHELGIAFIFVTHDQEEALTMSDRAAIMNFGRVLQVGTPEELYEAPNSLFVADFIGESNVFNGVIEMWGKEITVKQGDIVLRVSPEAIERVGMSDGDSVAIVVRPEHIQIRSADAEMFEYERMNYYKGRIVEVVYLGSTRNYIINLDNDTRVLAQTQAGEHSEGVAAGDQVFIGWDIKRGVLVPNAEQTLDEITTTHI